MEYTLHLIHEQKKENGGNYKGDYETQCSHNLLFLN